jgi:hypothetical protein
MKVYGMREERRVVTAPSTGLVGSTALRERLDPDFVDLEAMRPA